VITAWLLCCTNPRRCSPGTILLRPPLHAHGCRTEEQGGGDGKSLPPASSTHGGSNSSTGVHSRRNQRQPRAIRRGSHKNPWRVRLRQGRSPVAHDDPATLIGICTYPWRDSRTCSSGHTAEITPSQGTTQHAPPASQPMQKMHGDQPPNRRSAQHDWREQ